MARKQEIKVYLSASIVDELESRKRAGKRSWFIERAIRNALRGENEIDLWDIELDRLMKIVRARCYGDSVLDAVISKRLEEMK